MSKSKHVPSAMRDQKVVRPNAVESPPPIPMEVTNEEVWNRVRPPTLLDRLRRPQTLLGLLIPTILAVIIIGGVLDVLLSFLLPAEAFVILGIMISIAGVAIIIRRAHRWQPPSDQ